MVRQKPGHSLRDESPPVALSGYIGHDNNRDSFMLSVPETQGLNRVIHHDWYPHIFYNHHQTSPFPALIFVPPDSEPTNLNLPPLLLRWQNFIGTAIAEAFESEGKQGVISRFLFDTWYPGYITQVCDFHNIISTFSETFLFEYATPHFYTVKDFPPEYKDFTISLFFTNPWLGGWWHLRDAVEYCLTASKSVLDLAAKHKQELLYAKYAMGLEPIERYKKEPPFGRLLKTLFEAQVYPDLRRYPSLWQSIVEAVELKVPPLRTYDVLGWTLPHQMGVATSPLYSPLDVVTSPTNHRIPSSTAIPRVPCLRSTSEGSCLPGSEPSENSSKRAESWSL